MLATNQLQLQQTQANYEELVSRHEKLLGKYQESERALIQLTAHAKDQQKHAEKNEQSLSSERQAHNQLQQKAAVLTKQLHRMQNDLRQANEKVDTLRQEKLFLAQEKAQLEGALKQLQTSKVIA